MTESVASAPTLAASNTGPEEARERTSASPAQSPRRESSASKSSESSESDEPSAKFVLTISGLPADISDETLRNLCAESGKVKLCKIYTSDEKLPPRADVAFSDEFEASTALNKLNGYVLNGCKLSVSRLGEEIAPAPAPVKADSPPAKAPRPADESFFGSIAEAHMVEPEGKKNPWEELRQKRQREEYERNKHRNRPPRTLPDGCVLLTPNPAQKLHDWVFLALFLICSLAFAIIGLVSWGEAPPLTGSLKAPDGQTNDQYGQHISAALAITLVGGMMVSIGWIVVLIVFPKVFLFIALILASIFMFVIGLLGLIFGDATGGKLFGVALAAIVIMWMSYLTYFKERTAFSSALITQGVYVMLWYKHTFLVAAFGLLLSVIFSILYAIGFAGVLLGWGIKGQVLFSIYGLTMWLWTMQIIRNMVAMVCSAQFAMHYFLCENDERGTIPSVGLTVLGRTLLYHFGTVAYSVIAVFLVTLLRCMMAPWGLCNFWCRSRRRRLEHFGEYVPFMIALYGKNACHSASECKVVTECDDRIDTLRSGNVTGIGVFLTAAFTACFVAMLGALAAYSFQIHIVYTGVFGLVAGYVESWLMITPVEASVNAIFACFYEAPLTMERSMPDLLVALRRGAQYKVTNLLNARALGEL